MNFYIILVYTVIGNTTKAQLFAVHSSNYVLTLFNEIRNEEDPDPAESEQPLTRKLICEEIFANNWFRSTGWTLVDSIEIYENRYHRNYKHVARKIYSLNDDNYINPYNRRELRINSHHLHEDVFLCPVKAISGSWRKLMIYYVSKEYNLGSPLGLSYKPGRFIFPQVPTFGIRIQMVLAEEAAHALTDPDFNVELYYLGIRNHVNLEPDKNINSLCKLISDESDDPNNQYHRLCTAVIRSAPFRDIIMHPSSVAQDCSPREISFKTITNGRQILEEKYYEQMSLCYFGAQTRLYISRAYKSGEVFVYKRAVGDKELYLENLSMNVSILDELNSFDFVEE